MIKCRKCDKNKDYLEFYKKSSSKTGYQTICKECSKIEKRKWRAANPDKVKKWDQNRVYSPEAKAKRLKIGQARNKLYRDTLTDSYIANLIAMNSELKPQEICQELINAARINLKLKRALGLTNIKENHD